MGDESDIQGRCRLGDLESTAPYIIKVNLKKESEREYNVKRDLRMVFIYGNA